MSQSDISIPRTHCELIETKCKKLGYCIGHIPEALSSTTTDKETKDE